MKKLLTIFSIALIAFSCEEFSDGIYSGPDQVAFARTSAVGLYLEEAATGDNDLDSLEVQLIGPQRSTETTVTFELDATANQAVEGVHIDFVTTGGSVIIPANASSGYIYFNVLSDNFSITDNINLVLNLTSTDIKVAGNFAQTTKSLAITCESNLAGEYTVLSQVIGTGVDQCADGADYGDRTDFVSPRNITLTATSTIGVYEVSNPYGDLMVEYYAGCGYSTAIADAFEAGTVTDVCGDISGTFSSSFGADGGSAITGSYDGAGVITLTYTAYLGNQVTAVLTPTP